MLREQNVGASALLGREVVAWHRLAADSADVVLQTRPDVIFKAAIDVAKLRALFRGATTARVGVRVRVRVTLVATYPNPNLNPNPNH